MQNVDYTTLVAICESINSASVPSRLEQVYQLDRFTISLCLRSLTEKRWLTISWHPQAARICLDNPPPRFKDTFTLSEQLRHLINGYALIAVKIVSEWERVVDFQFAKRPHETPIYHLYVEIMGKYSNVILTNAEQQIITVARQITANQSSLRTVETSQIYQLPPPLTGKSPSLEESFESWQGRVNLIPGRIDRQLIQNYRGISPMVVHYLLIQAQIKPETSNQELSETDWLNLYHSWHNWLNTLITANFCPHLTKSGYSVLGKSEEISEINQLVNQYYTQELTKENFNQLKQQLKQKINNILTKLAVKSTKYKHKLLESNNAEIYREQADLLMANLQQWRPGMTEITLHDFTTEKPITIKIAPDKNAIQNAQALYKKHQKLKRAKDAVKPLLAEVQQEIDYLAQISTNLTQLELQESTDFNTLREIKTELINQKYLVDHQYRLSHHYEESRPRSYKTPSGYQVLVGRNNRQNDLLTSRIATDYDLWFHAQEIAGSHVLLRLNAGDIPEQIDLEYTANLAAYYSQGRESEQIPVVYTKPKYVYKPKGAKPGMVIYTRETVIWGKPSVIGRLKQEKTTNN
jgi:predicted ribosome quality control (RQC) complex YloA/Tae2 family protein